MCVPLSLVSALCIGLVSCIALHHISLLLSRFHSLKLALRVLETFIKAHLVRCATRRSHPEFGSNVQARLDKLEQDRTAAVAEAEEKARQEEEQRRVAEEGEYFSSSSSASSSPRSATDGDDDDDTDARSDNQMAAAHHHDDRDDSSDDNGNNQLSSSRSGSSLDVMATLTPMLFQDVDPQKEIRNALADTLAQHRQSKKKKAQQQQIRQLHHAALPPRLASSSSSSPPRSDAAVQTDSFSSTALTASPHGAVHWIVDNDAPPPPRAPRPQNAFTAVSHI